MFSLQIFKASPARKIKRPVLGLEELSPKLMLSGAGNGNPPPEDPPESPPGDNGGI